MVFTFPPFLRAWPITLAAVLLGLPAVAVAIPGDTGADTLREEARTFLHRGRDYAENEQWQAAIALYRNAIDINPRLADAHFLLGVAFAQQDRPRDSVRALKRAVQLDPQSASAFYNLGVAYAYTGDMEKEMDAYKEAIRLDPKHISAHYNLATAYWAKGRDQEACRNLYEAGRLYDRAGNPKQAREMLYLIQRIAPESEYRSRLQKEVRD
ncbi:tetratricopeptide repeat protein [Thiohalorhabdus sp. Cl-TMA]|uniref:Tetratricopeptide repeat protein n=1 Tax=Thiohalorhabdus methylotrophus TaxID=3242694 RepID=A0ABV4TZH9_9GAMM